MATLTTPYFYFNGNCKEAIAFYHSVFGGDMQVMTYGDMMGNDCPQAMKTLVAHANVRNGGIQLMASDSAREAAVPGNNVHVAVNVELADYESTFKRLSAGGKVEDAPQDMSWGQRFSTLDDKFGIKWIMTADLPKK